MSGAPFPAEVPPFCTCRCHDTYFEADARTLLRRKRPFVQPQAPRMTDPLATAAACEICQPIHLHAQYLARLQREDDGA